MNGKSASGNSQPENPIQDSIAYLSTGGLGEVIGLADAARLAGFGRILLDTDMALALCQLANESIIRRAAH